MLNSSSALTAIVSTFDIISFRPYYPFKIFSTASQNIIPRTKVSEERLKLSILIIFGTIPNNIDNAFKLAKEIHSKQMRNSGGGYLEGHIYPIVFYLIKYLNYNISEELIITALLHDVIEDAGNKINDVNSKLKLQFGSSIYSDINLLTKVKNSNKEEQEISYVNQILTARESIILIKCIDRIHNLLDDAVNSKNPIYKENCKKYLDKTINYYNPIFNRVGLSHPKISLLYTKITQIIEYNINLC